MHHLRVYQPYAHQIRRGMIIGDNNILEQGSNLLSSLVGGEFTTINKNSRASPTSSTHATRSTQAKGGGALPSSHEFTTIDKNSRASSSSSTSSTSSPTTSTSSHATSTSSSTPSSSHTSSSPSSSTSKSDSKTGAGAGGGASSTPSTMRRSSRMSSSTSSETPTKSSSGDGVGSSSTPASTGNSVSETQSTSSPSSAPSSASNASSGSSDASDSGNKSDEESKSSSPSMNNASNARKPDEDGGTDHTGLIAGVCTAGGVVILAILGFVLYKLLNKRAGSTNKPEQAIQWPDVTYDAGPTTQPTTLVPAQHDAPGDTSVDMSGYDDNPFNNHVHGAAAPISAQSQTVPESYVDVPPATFGYTSDGHTQPVTESTALATTHPAALVPSQSPTPNVPVSVPLPSEHSPSNVLNRGSGAEFQHFVVGQTYPEEATHLPYDAPVTRELYQEQQPISPFDEKNAVKN